MNDNSKKFVRIGIGVLVINKKGKILLGRRKSEHGYGTYALPGGHLEFGESFEHCAARELKEETSLDGYDFKVVSLENGFGDTEKHYVTIGLLAGKHKGNLKVMEPNKCENWTWYEKNNLPKPLFPPTEKVIENYFSGRIYKP